MIFAGIAGIVFLFLAGAVLACTLGLKRFTAGSTTDSAFAIAKAKNEQDIRVIASYAAEAAGTDAEAERTVVAVEKLLDEMTAHKIRGDIAVKPSSLVAARWNAAAQRQLYSRLAKLARHAARSGRTMWIDREHAADGRWVLPVEKKLLGTRNGKQFIPRFSNIGLVVQAYRKNSLRIAGAFAEWHTRGARFRVRVCRGAYPREAELSSNETACRFLTIHRRLVAWGISTVAATHTLVPAIAINSRQPPIVHMLYGRREIETILEPLAAVNCIREPAVYVIYGPLWARLRYLLRRFWEDPRLILWFWK
ncbi:MAG: proline dehydrogenase family protein [Candidatus Niyogibacteria bacterium]|nr:proline dehydrogenase family protein [Candidatus Niyogibacteria bacterium]